MDIYVAQLDGTKEFDKSFFGVHEYGVWKSQYQRKSMMGHRSQLPTNTSGR